MKQTNQTIGTIIIGLLIISSSVYVGIVIGNNKQKSLTPIPKCSDTDLYYFKAGYHDSYINIARRLIHDCGEFPIRVVEQLDFSGKPIGILYWCQMPNKNLTIPIHYSPLYYKNPNLNRTIVGYDGS